MSTTAEQPLQIQTTWQSAWRPERIGTLLFLVHDGQVLLIHKKTGHGAGVINGPGGKLQAGETLVECAVPEVQEEVGVTVSNVVCRAEMRFVEEQGTQWLGYAFIATQLSGDPYETEEAKPFWCPLDAIPFDKMWPDDKRWLPRVLASDAGPPFIIDVLLRADELIADKFLAQTEMSLNPQQRYLGWPGINR